MSAQQSGSLVGAIARTTHSLSGHVAVPTMLPTQSKEFTPTQSGGTVYPDAGYALSSVVVKPIPSNYGLITYNGFELTVS